MSFYVFGALLAICISGKFGRRPQMLWSSLVIDLCLFFMGICVMYKFINHVFIDATNLSKLQ